MKEGKSLKEINFRVMNVVSFSFLLRLLIEVWNNSPKDIIPLDLSSFIASANQFLIDQTLYSSFFNINPPFLFEFYILFGKLFGFGFLGLKILNVALVFGHFFFLKRILLRLNNQMIAFFAFNFAIALAYTKEAYQMFLSSESIATWFMLFALYLTTNTFLKIRTIIFIGVLIAFAMQTKETYAFLIIFAIFACWCQDNSKFRKIWTLIITVFLTNLSIFLFLFCFNELDDYWNVLDLKKNRFQLSDWKNSIITGIVFINRHIQLSGYFTIIVFTILIYLGAVRSSKSSIFSLDFSSSNYLLFLFLLSYAAIFVGLFWGNRNFANGHVFITFLFPYILLMSFGFEYLMRYSQIERRTSYLVYAILVSTILINLVEHNWHQSVGNSENVSRQLHNYKVIERKNFMPESCIQNAYGWNSGAAYFHTGYRPCSKYFLLNLIIADKKRLLEFKADMISSAPRAIIYEIDSGPDLNWKIFEKEVFPYQTILQICYDKAKGSDVYFAKFEGFSQGLCIRDASKKQ